MLSCYIKREKSKVFTFILSSNFICTGKFMILLGKCILGCVRQAQQANNGGHLEQGQGDGDSSQNESQVEDDEQTLSLKDDDVMEGMLEIIAILWAGINSQLSKVGTGHVLTKTGHWVRELPEWTPGRGQWAGIVSEWRWHDGRNAVLIAILWAGINSQLSEVGQDMSWQRWDRDSLEWEIKSTGNSSTA